MVTDLALPKSSITFCRRVVAGFASGWGTEEGASPGSAKPRAGYIAELMGCPAAWCSKLQASAATSAMEAECAALELEKDKQL